MPFPVSLRGKLELKSYLEGSTTPERLRDEIVSSLTGLRGYSVRTDNSRILITFLWSYFFRASGGILYGLSNGEIVLYPKEKSLTITYKFSMIHLLFVSTVIILLLFLLNINNPTTTTHIGLLSLGLLWCFLFVGSYVVTAILTAIRFPRFLRRCARDASENETKIPS